MEQEKLEELKKKFLGSPKNDNLSQIEKANSIQAAIARDLPSWRLCESSLEEMGIRRPALIEDIKIAVKRDLLGWHLSPNFIEKNLALKAIKSSQTITVRLNNSSTEKIADYKDGKVQIVQG